MDDSLDSVFEEDFKFLPFYIDKIELTGSSLIFNYGVGLNSFKTEIPISSSFFLPASNSYGLLYDCKNTPKFSSIKFKIFITNQVLDNLLKKETVDTTFNNWIEADGWMVEKIRTYKDYQLYFLKPYFFNPYKDDTIIPHDLIKGCYKNNKNEKFLLINFPIGNSVLVEIKESTVSANNSTYNLKIFIGSLSFYDLDCYVYIIDLVDLINIRSNNTTEDLVFDHDNHSIPIPNLPLIPEIIPFYEPNMAYPTSVFEKKINTFSTFITDSKILCIHTLPCVSKKLRNFINFFDNIDLNNLIILEEYKSWDKNRFIAEKPELMPYNFIVSGPDILYDMTSFFEPRKNKTKDYDYLGFNIIEENDISEMDNQIEYELNFYWPREERVLNAIRFTYCVFLCDYYAIFKIIRGNNHQTIACPVTPINGVAKAGILEIDGIGEIQFVLINDYSKCNINLDEFLREEIGFNKYHTKYSNKYAICFNLKIVTDFKFCSSPLQYSTGAIYKGIFRKSNQNEDLKSSRVEAPI